MAKSKKRHNEWLKAVVRYYCPSPLELNLYIDGKKLSKQRREFIKQHLNNCPECMEEYRSLKSFDMREVAEDLKSYLPPESDIVDEPEDEPVPKMKEKERSLQKYDKELARIIRNVQMQIKGNRPKKALDIIEKAIKVQPNEVELLVLKGLITQNLGWKRKAKAVYEKILSLMPSHYRARLHLGIILSDFGNHGMAIRQFKYLIEKEPDNILAYIYLAKTYTDLDLILLSEKELKKIILTMPYYAPTHLHLGYIYLRMHVYDKAISELEIALKLDLEYGQGHYLLSLAYFERHLYDKAMKHIITAIELEGSFEKCYLLMAQILEAVNEKGDAIRLLEAANEQYSDFGFVANYLGVRYYESKDYDRAIAYFKKSLEIHKTDIEIRYNLALSLIRKGQYREAVLEFKKILKNQPDHKPSLLNISILKPKKSIKSIQKQAISRLVDLMHDRDIRKRVISKRQADTQDVKTILTHFKEVEGIDPRRIGDAVNKEILYQNMKFDYMRSSIES